MTLDDARELARARHAGQVDKAGRDYVDAHLRPIAEAAATFGPEAEEAGWLHDIVEDTGVTLAELASHGFSPDVVAAVDAVTRRAEETYDDLITRACAHPLGRLVKLVDNAWNITSNPTLATLDPERAEAMLTDRYLPARRRLLAAAGLSEGSPAVVEVQRILDLHRTRLSSRAPEGCEPERGL